MMPILEKNADIPFLAGALETMDAEKRAMLLGYLSGMVDSAVVERKKEKDSKAGEKTEK